MKNLKINKKETKAIRDKMAASQKIKITINLDEDILTEVKNEAKETGIPYQKLLNRILRHALSEKKDREDRIDRLEKELEKIKKKISA
jgi:predicted DNA binding CopG/RHH family protein